MVQRSKAELRAAILLARRSVSRRERETEARALTRHLSGLVTGAPTVCAYVPIGTEPGSLTLIDDLHGRGVRVLLPVARSDVDGVSRPLQWGDYRPGELVDAPHGLREPAPPWLTAEAIADASLILVPALAVDHAGVRLGRGAGFYDRSLRLADAAARLIAVVRDDELVDALPCDEHDVWMTHALTPRGGLVELGRYQPGMPNTT